MNNTIDFNTAKTIGTMSKKIDHIDDTVSGFFSFMHMVMQNELGNAEPYFAAVSPVLDLTVIRPDDPRFKKSRARKRPKIHRRSMTSPHSSVMQTVCWVTVRIKR